MALPPLGQLLHDIIRQNVQRQGVRVFKEGFDGLDWLCKEGQKRYGIQISDEQMQAIKMHLAQSVRHTRKIP